MLRDNNTAELHISICLHWVHICRESINSKGRNKKEDGICVLGQWFSLMVFWEEVAKQAPRFFSHFLANFFFRKKSRYNSFIFHHRIQTWFWCKNWYRKHRRVKLIISKKGRRKNTSYTKVVEEILILWFFLFKLRFFYNLKKADAGFE